jgi:CRISPR-associated protein Cas2
MERLYLICYDISDDRIRKKVADKLIYYGLERLQYSVFAGMMGGTLFEEAKKWLQETVPEKDSILLLPLPPQIDKSALSFGTQSVNWPSILNQLHTLYID